VTDRHPAPVGPKPTGRGLLCYRSGWDAPSPGSRRGRGADPGTGRTSRATPGGGRRGWPRRSGRGGDAGPPGIETLVLDQASDVGASWRSHYDRLHLHTVRWLSGLPGMPISRSEGPWVAREGVVRYLEEYARRFDLNVRAGVEVRAIHKGGSEWVVAMPAGSIMARWVVVATGFNREPYMPEWPGRDSFTGRLIHSCDYRNPEPYGGHDVLVVGTGNSGAEICVDLVEGGSTEVSLSVRTPPNILRRDVGRFPTQALGVVMRKLPVRLVDRMTAMTQRVTVGDLSKHGLPRPPKGMYSRAVQDDQIPILDVGLIDLLKAGKVRVVGPVEGFEGSDVLLAGGERLRPYAVIAATGFRRGLEPLVGHLGLVGGNGRPVVHGVQTHSRAPNLFFIGFSNPISGNLREIGIDARRIARAVARGAGPGSAGRSLLSSSRWARYRAPLPDARTS
jgi:putative flavoprotein involved in K+ transport